MVDVFLKKLSWLFMVAWELMLGEQAVPLSPCRGGASHFRVPNTDRQIQGSYSSLLSTYFYLFLSFIYLFLPISDFLTFEYTKITYF